MYESMRATHYKKEEKKAKKFNVTITKTFDQLSEAVLSFPFFFLYCFPNEKKIHSLLSECFAFMFG